METASASVLIDAPLRRADMTQGHPGVPAAPADAHAEAVAAAESAESGSLSRRDVDILKFERHWWLYAGNKEQAIRDMFDLSPTRYYQVLNQIIDNPDALAAEPLLVRRLRRVRTTRQKDRAARRLGVDRRVQ